MQPSPIGAPSVLKSGGVGEKEIDEVCLSWSEVMVGCLRTAAVFNWLALLPLGNIMA